MHTDQQRAQQREKIDFFRNQLKAGAAFIMPEAWDVVSARILASLDFKVIGTSATAIAWVNGYKTNEQVKLEEVLMVAARIARGAKYPVNVDMSGCVGTSVEDITRAAQAAATVGCSGLILSDMARGALSLLSVENMVKRIKTAREAASLLGVPLVITAQMDAFSLKDKAPSALNEAMTRTQAYHMAGADNVLITGLQHSQVLEKIIQSASGPISITISQSTTTDLKSYQRIGVSCVSVGSTMLRSLLGNLRLKADELKTFGQFTHLDRAISKEEIENLMG